MLRTIFQISMQKLCSRSDNQLTATPNVPLGGNPFERIVSTYSSHRLDPSELLGGLGDVGCGDGGAGRVHPPVNPREPVLESI